LDEDMISFNLSSPPAPEKRLPEDRGDERDDEAEDLVGNEYGAWRARETFLHDPPDLGCRLAMIDAASSWLACTGLPAAEDSLVPG
jgi:hypothetical protein